MEITASSFKLRANAPEGRKRFPIMHQCDAAVFRVELASGSGHVVLGTADLNNGDDGGDRGPFTFPVTQAHLDSLNSP